MITPTDIPNLSGKAIVDEHGLPVGVLVTSYADPDTGNPLWASVRRHTGEIPDLFVPLTGASLETGTVRVVVSIGVLAGSPLIYPPFTFTDDTARRLDNYYNAATTIPLLDVNHAVPPGGPAQDRAPEAAAWMVRSEEHLHVGTERVPIERVRFRKVIVTEEKTFTVTVRREELRMVRELPTDAQTVTASAPSGADGFDIVLHEERPVFTLEVVPVERVRVDVVTATSNQTVTGTVKKERVSSVTSTAADDGHDPEIPATTHD